MKTHCIHGHERTPENISSTRTCKRCVRIRASAWNKAHPEKHAAWAKAHPERKAYAQAKQRCNNPNMDTYKDYGGRGIQFKFSSFEEFNAELGPRPTGKSIDRINNDGHYEPGNVRWATPKEQANNRRL